MVIIIGFIIIMGGTIVGFMMAGGTIGLLSTQLKLSQSLACYSVVQSSWHLFPS